MFSTSLAQSYQEWMKSNKTFTFLISFLFPYEHRSNSITKGFYKLFTVFRVGKKHIERELSSLQPTDTTLMLILLFRYNCLRSQS